MLSLVVTLLGATVWAEYKVFEIIETKESFAGFYVETENALKFQRLGGRDRYDYFFYLYRNNREEALWNIGYGKNQQQITVAHEANSTTWKERNVPPKDGWTSARKGKIKSFKVIGRPSLVSKSCKMSCLPQAWNMSTEFCCQVGVPECLHFTQETTLQFYFFA